MEQPDAIRRTVAPRIKNGQIELGLSKIDADVIRSLERVYIVACGSAYHVGMVARYAIERYAKIPVSCDLASEFRYNDPMVNANTLVIIISQSGETLDTLFALREAKIRGAHTLSIVNVVGSSIACESEDVLYTWAGPEIAVATTKALAQSALARGGVLGLDEKQNFFKIFAFGLRYLYDLTVHAFYHFFFILRMSCVDYF